VIHQARNDDAAAEIKDVALGSTIAGMSEDATRLVVVLGPTAGGKSELAAAIAETWRDVTSGQLPGEVIGADSMQVYRHLDAGTAKPPRSLRQRVPHHLLDVVEPSEKFTVADWLAQADAIIADCQERGVRPIVVGGTNLYIKALLEGLFDSPSANPMLRAALDTLDNHVLHARLTDVDPTAAARIHVNDRKKMIRALEVYELTGKPISTQQTQWREETAAQADVEMPGGYRHDPILIGLRWEVEALNRRINARVKAMFQPADDAESLPEEVRRLEAAGLLPIGCQAREALGYKQVLAALHPNAPHGRDARIQTLDDALEQTKILTRRFAKTQRTWLKRFRGVRWIEGAEVEQRGAETVARLMEDE
jgi:tRNA dimethylallyltransferase